MRLLFLHSLPTVIFVALTLKFSHRFSMSIQNFLTVGSCSLSSNSTSHLVYLFSKRKGTKMPSERTSGSKLPSHFQIPKSNMANYHFSYGKRITSSTSTSFTIPIYSYILLCGKFTELLLIQLSGEISSDERPLISRCKLNHMLRGRYKGLVDTNHRTPFSFPRTSSSEVKLGTVLQEEPKLHDSSNEASVWWLP